MFSHRLLPMLAIFLTGDMAQFARDTSTKIQKSQIHRYYLMRGNLTEVFYTCLSRGSQWDKTAYNRMAQRRVRSMCSVSTLKSHFYFTVLIID